MYLYIYMQSKCIFASVVEVLKMVVGQTVKLNFSYMIRHTLKHAWKITYQIY